MRPGRPLKLSGNPAEVFARCWEEPGAVLLETQRPTVRERYSFIARAPRRVLVLDRAHHGSAFFEALESASRHGFCLGYLGYDLRLLTEELPDANPGLIPLPAAWMGVYDSLLFYHHFTHHFHSMEAAFLPFRTRAATRRAPSVRLNLTRPKEAYLQSVKLPQAYI